MLKRRNRILAFMAVVMLFISGFASAVEITVNEVPADVTEFIAFRDKTALTPEGGAVVFLLAMLAFSDNQKLGMQCFTIALDQGNLSKGDVYKGYKPNGGAMYHIDRLADPKRKRTPYFYVNGTKFDDGYQAELPYQFTITTNAYSILGKDKMKVFVQCSGNVMPRPMTMKRNDKGLWKTVEFSSFSLDVSMPSEQKDDL